MRAQGDQDNSFIGAVGPNYPWAVYLSYITCLSSRHDHFPRALLRGMRILAYLKGALVFGGGEHKAIPEY